MKQKIDGIIPVMLTPVDLQPAKSKLMRTSASKISTSSAVLLGRITPKFTRSVETELSKGYLRANRRARDQDKFQQFSGTTGPTIKKYGSNFLTHDPFDDRRKGDGD